MADAFEQAAWNVVLMHGLREGTATVMTSCEGVIVWLAPDAPKMEIASVMNDVPVRVGRRPAFLRSECDDTEVRCGPSQADEPPGDGHAG